MNKAGRVSLSMELMPWGSKQKKKNICKYKNGMLGGKWHSKVEKENVPKR